MDEQEHRLRFERILRGGRERAVQRSEPALWIVADDHRDGASEKPTRRRPIHVIITVVFLLAAMPVSLLVGTGLIDVRDNVRIAGCRAKYERRRAVARLVAYVLQRPLVPLAMAVTNGVLLGHSAHRHVHGPDTRRDRRVVAAVLERLELSSLERRALEQASGGEAQHAAPARAVPQGASVLLMDEPTSSLDLGHSQLVLELADALRRKHGLIALAALHDLTLASQYADRLVVWSKGPAVLDDRAANVLDAAVMRTVFDASVEALGGQDRPVVAPTRPRQDSLALPLLEAAPTRSRA